MTEEELEPGAHRQIAWAEGAPPAVEGVDPAAMEAAIEAKILARQQAARKEASADRKEASDVLRDERKEASDVRREASDVRREASDVRKEASNDESLEALQRLEDIAATTRNYTMATFVVISVVALVYVMVLVYFLFINPSAR